MGGPTIVSPSRQLSLVVTEHRDSSPGRIFGITKKHNVLQKNELKIIPYILHLVLFSPRTPKWHVTPPFTFHVSPYMLHLTPYIIHLHITYNILLVLYLTSDNSLYLTTYILHPTYYHLYLKSYILRVTVSTPLALGPPGGLEIRTSSVAGYIFLHRICCILAIKMVGRRKYVMSAATSEI